jgi:hypothetical protein
MRMKNPVFHQDSLFVIRGYDVLQYSVKADLFTLNGSFPFSDPIEKIESAPEGLIVTTTHQWLLICGGPQAVTYYVNLIADRTPDTVLDGTLRVIRSTELLRNPLSTRSTVHYEKA